MKTKMMLWLLLVTLGCNNVSPVESIDTSAPLLLEQWKTMTPAEKYAPENLERLRAHQESFRDESKWDEFMRTVVVVERRRDIPIVY